MSYEIYWNLHRKKFSVRHGGRVIAHAESVNAFDATFVVRPGGQRRVRETGKKNVHAFVKTDLVEVLEAGAPPIIFRKTKVKYDPRVNDTFVDPDNNPVFHAGAVSLRIRNSHPEILV